MDDMIAFEGQERQEEDKQPASKKRNIYLQVRVTKKEGTVYLQTSPHTRYIFKLVHLFFISLCA